MKEMFRSIEIRAFSHVVLPREAQRWLERNYKGLNPKQKNGALAIPLVSKEPADKLLFDWNNRN